MAKVKKEDKTLVLTHKTEIFPTKEQIKQLEINFGLRRFYFNKMIVTLKERYNNNLKKYAYDIKLKELQDIRSNIRRLNSVL